MLSVLFFVAVLFVGIAVLWAVHERQERHVAKGGYYVYLESRRWQKKRAMCKKRFGGLCALCGSPHNGQAHHITYRNLYNEKPLDLVWLCADCHTRWAPRSKGLYNKGR